MMDLSIFFSDLQPVALLAEFQLRSMLPAAVILLVVIFTMKRLKRRSQGRPKKLTPIVKVKLRSVVSADPLRDAPPEVHRWHVEMHDVARELTAQLDSKMRALQSFTRAAAQEADRLEGLLERVEQRQGAEGVDARVAGG
jgi:hypothetical protein